MVKPKIQIEQLWSYYQECKSVWKTAEHFGLCGQSVQERLRKHGYELDGHGKKFSQEEDEAIKLIYSMSPTVRDLNLKGLAARLGRHHTNICRRAKRLGLTFNARKHTEEQAYETGLRSKAWIEKNGHPRGALGMKHTPETIEKMSKASKAMWANPSCRLNSVEHRRHLSDRMSKLRTTEIAAGGYHPYSRAKKGWYEASNGKRYYLKSGWETKYANYLEVLKKAKAIKGWEYEADTFWFQKIKRGVRSYTPDFKIEFLNKDTEYHEVKGWMDTRSMTKIKRMAIYHPGVKLVVMGEPELKSLGLV